MFKHNYSNRSSFTGFIQLIALVLLSTLSAPIHAGEVTQEYSGLTLNANLEMAEGKDYKDGIVLILHGYLAHNKMEIISSSQQALLAIDKSSLAINLSLGIDNRHGFYDCTWPHRHLQENAVDELSAWVGWLRDRGVSQVTLMGHSRGANQIMVYAVDQRDLEVTQLVMLAPGAGENVKVLYRERYGKKIDETLAFAYKQVVAGKGGDLMEGADLLGCPKASVTADSFISYYSENNKFRQFTFYLPKISIPTLIITGTLDERQPNVAEIVKPLVKSDYIRLSVVDGAGHFFRDFNIEEAMEVSVEFIDR